ncbi:nucleotidyl transferase AbiEii/AbiGii toxin family protein [Patescibacteria group bacterium]|nr:nucleotidyl transferase AbiEii/AbiGii toxin family protein [Patescibacteria group bacterium]MBU4458586.1 nucleotidyl transferase AbiEii/AbiGii toxin family protein [Patescibacteria group bacterium]MCG2696343.1 nucleotidyl transferase AbiEii/AbiGii toxin family protein [Candidatus Portnoybacteria bacterium]
MTDITKHKNIMIKILKDIYTDNTLGPVLGFKGGTAALLFYGLDRFSVDLDFDLLDETKEDYVFKQIKKILENYGTIKEARKKRFNLFYLLSYTEKTQGEQNIKIEVNRRNFDSKYEVTNYYGISMLVMTKEDMFAHKMVAMYERIEKTSRDVFDVWYFLQNDWPINKQIVENRTKISYKEFLSNSIKALEKLDNKNILAGMGELLDKKQKIWAKTNLKKDVLFLLRMRLEE